MKAAVFIRTRQIWEQATASSISLSMAARMKVTFRLHAAMEATGPLRFLLRILLCLYLALAIAATAQPTV
jgi:hypothetical protein